MVQWLMAAAAVPEDLSCTTWTLVTEGEIWLKLSLWPHACAVLRTSCPSHPAKTCNTNSPWRWRALKIYFYFYCVYVLCILCVCVSHVCRHLRAPQEGTGWPGTVLDSCELPPRSSEVFFTAEDGSFTNKQANRPKKKKRKKPTWFRVIFVLQF